MAIKLIDNTARFEIVSQHDDAIIGETFEELQALRAANETTRFEKYMDSLNLSDLQVKAGEAATVFVVRGLNHKERSELQEKFITVDVATKKFAISDQNAYLTSCFEKAVLGVKDSSGNIIPVSADDVGPLHAMSIGSTILHITMLGKNLKKL